MKKALIALVLVLGTQQLFASTTATKSANKKNPTTSRSMEAAYYPTYVYIAGNGVRLRSTPTTNTSKNIVTAVNRGTVLRCVGVSGNWWKVVWGNKHLWVSKDFALAYNLQ